MAELPFPRIAVLGTGLMGGSFALAVRRLGARVTGYDRPEVLFYFDPPYWGSEGEPCRWVEVSMRWG